MTDRRTARIVVFTAIAFGWAWLWWAISIILLREAVASPTAALTTFFGTCAPVVAAWVLWWRASGPRQAWRKLGRCLLPSGPWVAWTLPALAILSVITAAAWVQQRLGG